MLFQLDEALVDSCNLGITRSAAVHPGNVTRSSDGRSSGKSVALSPSQRSPRGQGRIAIVEGLRFLRECLCLSIDGAIPLEVETFPSLSMMDAHADLSSFEMVVISWMGSEENKSEENVAELRRLRSALPGVAIVILADGQDPNLAGLAIANGAKGYIPMTLGLEIAVEVLRFVLAGGTFAPADMVLRTDLGGAVSPAGSASMAITSREMRIIDAIQQGKPNKVIAFELGMNESTVKIHVRHVMKKFGAKNRTDLAVKARDIVKPSG